MQSAAIAMIREKSAGLHERTTGQLLLYTVIIDEWETIYLTSSCTRYLAPV